MTPRTILQRSSRDSLGGRPQDVGAGRLQTHHSRPSSHGVFTMPHGQQRRRGARTIDSPEWSLEGAGTYSSFGEL